MSGYPYGKIIQGLSTSSTYGKNNYKYNGKELQTELELGWLDYGARMLDGPRWFVPDPLAEKYYNMSPYVYCLNNPLIYIDPLGLDTAQRANAIALAHEYVAQNPGNSYQNGGRGNPGKGVDCSGMVANCIISGEEPDPILQGSGNGVNRIAQASEQVTNNNDIEAGNVVTLDNSETGTTNPKGHIGIITEVRKDINGNTTGYQIADSGGNPKTGQSGPRYTEITIGGSRYYDSRVTGVYKWDTRPETYHAGTLPSITIRGQGSTYKQPIKSNKLQP